jgi:phage repressor protein C with HTH and peptisase S24 domain
MDLKLALSLWMREKNLDQTELGRIADVPQPTINRILLGVTGSPRGDTLSKIAKAMDISIDQLMLGPNQQKTVNPQPQAPSEEDYALIPQYSSSADCGAGLLNDHVEVKGGMAFKRDWMARLNLKEENLSVIYAQGQSMEPTIREGSVLLLDKSQRKLESGKVYALLHDGDFRVKRLFKNYSHQWIVRSDNGDKTLYPDETVATSDDAERFMIVGRIVWQGGEL